MVNRKIAAIIFLVLMSISSLSFSAVLKSMTKDQIEQALVNKTMISIPVDNLNGHDLANILSVSLDKEGRITGTLKHKPADEPQTDQGTYRIKDDGTLFITWKHWQSAEEMCLHVFDTKNAYISIDCNNNLFRIAFMKDDMRSGNRLK